MFEPLDALVKRLQTTAPAGPADPSRPDVWPPVLDPDGAVVDEIVALERVQAMVQARVMILTAALTDRAESWLTDEERERVHPRYGAPEPIALAAAELAPALHLSPVTAGMRVHRAVDIRDRLPGTLAAFSRGDLDLGRVLAIVDRTSNLPADDVAAVEEHVLPDAPNQTAAELRAALRRAVITINPGAAEERRKAALRERGVVRYEMGDGTSAFHAVLSAIDAGEMYDLVDEVARRTKTEGDARTMDMRRADALVLLMLGREPALGPVDAPPPPPADPPPTPPSSPPPPPAGPSSPPPPGATSPPPPGASPQPPTADSPPPARPSSPPAAGPSSPPPPAAASPPPAGPSSPPPSAASKPPPAAASPPPPELDDVGADRTLVGAEPNLAETHVDGADDGRQDAEVWSQWPDAAETALRVADLNELDRDQDADVSRAERISELAALFLSAMIIRRPPHLPWVVINEVTRSDGTTVYVGELEGYGPVTEAYAEHVLSAGLARAPDTPSGRRPTLAQAATHDPPSWLDTEVRARDGTCRAPGCRRPARRGDLDHTVPHPRGPTVAENLGGLCRGHHRLKGCGTWRVTQHITADGTSVYTWVSKITGRTYLTYPRGMTGEWRGATTVSG